MVTKHRSNGGVKHCRLHDTLHDFCLRKVEEENFSHLLRGQDNLSSFDEPCYLQRLCILDDACGFKESKLFCPRARSLLFFCSQKKLVFQQYWLATSFVTPIFKRLKVLDMEQIHLGIFIPSEIGMLFQLKYLSIRGKMTVVPSWIGDLSNLETFILQLERVSSAVPLPHTLWNLKKLRWISIKMGGGILSVENLEDSPILEELESFSCAVIAYGTIMEKQMQKFPNIRRLKCDVAHVVKEMQVSDDNLMDLDSLRQLESLHLLRSDLATVKTVVFDLCLPEYLTKLTLSRLGLPWEKISPIAKLPYLEVLKLLDSCFSGSTWQVGHEDFMSLRVLKLSRLDIVFLATEGDAFDCLERLVLDHCSHLEKIPSEILGNCYTLERIEVFNCSESLERSVKNILKQQRELLGHVAFEISIR